MEEFDCDLYDITGRYTGVWRMVSSDDGRFVPLFPLPENNRNEGS